MTSTTTTKNDSLEQLFHKLLSLPEASASSTLSSTPQQQQQSPYLFLVQHSQSLQTRQTAAAVQHQQDESVYRRAGLRTPAETAARDWQAVHLWLPYIVGELQKEQPCTVLWVQTSSRSTPAWLAKNTRRVTVLDASATDPFGWDDDDSNHNSHDKGGGLLNDLDQLATAIEERIRTLQQQQQQPFDQSNSNSDSNHTPIVLESLTPLLLRHGLRRTMHFLQRLSQTARPVVAAVLTESIPAAQHQALEDLAQAVLCLAAGQAVLLRQGVRETGNLVRENLPYRIVTDAKTTERRLVVMVDTVLNDIATEASEPGTTSATAAGPVSAAAAAPTVTAASAAVARPKKMQLQDDDGPRKQVATAARTTATVTAATTSSAGGPRIFLQDDDPEFEDYDEEDPDDDLDL